MVYTGRTMSLDFYIREGDEEKLHGGGIPISGFLDLKLYRLGSLICPVPHRSERSEVSSG